MAWSFSDSFDCYAVIADAANGYWDTTSNNWSLSTTTRFGVGQSLTNSATSVYLTKSSGQNDAVHHLIVAFRQTTALSGSSLGLYLQLLDGTTGQVCIIFRGDGAIILTSGTTGGATLATYTGAVTTNLTWFAFEFEIVVSSTVGRFRVRKNGNPVDDFDSGAVLNTRPGANSYANKLQVGFGGGFPQNIDDLYWRSDASSVAWMGDIRCYTRAPASDAAVQFSRSTGATNFSCVDEPQQNTTTDYVFSSTPGQTDFYGIAAIASTPVTSFAVVTRAYMIKSDAGTRTAAVQLKSGSSTVASPTVVLTTSNWQWAWRHDTVDPNTSSAWTAAAVNLAQCGPVIIA